MNLNTALWTRETAMGDAILPPVDEWNLAVAHSLANPTHVLGPYEGDDGQQHVDCSCGWDTETLMPP